ncbi:hypothetical protein [Halomonas sp. OfavH-34-E]|uniref:hypothetical protein n=1 Tax=Halomonas sp. OfavH-34-E TaxID=2954491 RepID=UPI002097F04A|nr:hypothetical protein [Halomonas sp. OfavH-34-E]MCO7217086.1 hypothetical protein [Halomonas sp. OfavH-34-E]
MKIERLDGYGDTQFMTKGHVDREQFRREVLEQHGHHADEPKHIYMRKRPDPSGNYHWIAEECRPGRGAFKATFAECGPVAKLHAEGDV